MADSVTFKVLVVGPFGVGKTTFIEQISSVPVVGTEAPTTGEEAHLKSTTTVGIEYGLFTVGDDEMEVTLLLFGTPGQNRFSDVRDVAARGIDGLIVLVDGTDEPTWPIATGFYETFNPDGSIPTLIGINRWPDDSAPPPGLLEQLDPIGPVVNAHGHVIDPDDARRFLIDLLSAMLDREIPEDAPAMEKV
jgi:signal recognition particle receptor subunit beta